MLTTASFLGIRVVVFLLSALIVVGTLFSATRTFVLPRSASDKIIRTVWRGMRALFDLRMRFTRTYNDRDRILALYAPVTLLVTLATWLALVLLGYMGMYWALQIGSPRDAFTISGSSLFTLGSASAGDIMATVLSFSEAMVGLILVALLISYLPTGYATFSRREAAVALLEVRAGSPPSAVEMFLRYGRIRGLERLGALWPAWEAWFVDIEETHTSLAMLTFFRSPRPERSWVTAAGAVLDAAALASSTLDLPPDPQQDLCIRAGFLALRHIVDFFGIPYDGHPKPTDPISVTRAEFDAACERLAAGGIPLKPDRDQAWRDFAGWRVNYDTVLLVLCRLTMAPDAPWSSDRASRGRRAARTVPQRVAAR